MSQSGEGASVVDSSELNSGRLAKFVPVIGLAGLSLIWALEALAPDMIPSIKPNGGDSFLGHSLSLGIVALVAILVALVKRAGWPYRQEIPILVTVGCALFVLPALMVWWSEGQTTAYERTLLFSLVPIFSVVLEPHLGNVSSARLRGGTLAALACTAGELLVFPVDIPSTLSSGLASGSVVLAAIVIATMSCVAHGILSGDSRRGSGKAEGFEGGYGAAAVMAAGGTFGSLLIDAITCAWKGSIPRAAQELSLTSLGWALIEATGYLLLLWLLPRLRPSRAATRYVLAPLLTVCLGVLLLRIGGQTQATLQLRTIAGLSIMGAGAIFLVFSPETTPERDRGPSLGLR